MLIYKYVVPERVDVLENGCVRFTQAKALNDPFEVYPCFSLLRKSLEDRAQRQLRSFGGRISEAQKIVHSVMMPGQVKDEVSNMQNKLSNEYLVLSLTKKRNNLLMWSHYTYSHTGFVIGFDSDNAFFNRKKPTKVTSLKDVKYSSERPVVPRLEDCGSQDIHEIVLLTKSDHWSYEEEVRMFAQRQAADTVRKIGNGLDIYLLNMPSECFREVIFGALMEKALKQRIFEIAANKYPHIKLYEARLSETKFDLDITPYRNRRT